MAYSKKVASKASIVNRNQGGGNKKAGFPYQVGRSAAASVILDTRYSCSRQLCLGMNLFPNACASRPIGGGVANLPYYHCRGTR